MASDLEDVSSLVERATTLFREKYEYDPSVVVCSPGRVNLIGNGLLILNENKEKTNII